jgi:HK97 family phage prohead protease
MDAKKEIRNLECQLAFREASEEASSKGILGTICGRAICFNAESQVLDEYGQTFREVIAPEAATMEFLNTQDIKINMLHMRELTFGRAKRGVSGNARLSVDNEGVNFEVDVPNCDLGIRARELTKAGVYDGCSFEFWPDKYDVEEREGKVPLVRHTHFRAITALTLGMDPAYLQTSLHARELYDQTPAGIADKKAEEEQRKREEQEKAESMKKEMHRRLKHLQRMADFDNKLESSIF